MCLLEFILTHYRITTLSCGCTTIRFKKKNKNIKRTENVTRASEKLRNESRVRSNKAFYLEAGQSIYNFQLELGLSLVFLLYTPFVLDALAIETDHCLS